MADMKGDDTGAPAGLVTALWGRRIEGRASTLALFASPHNVATCQKQPPPPHTHWPSMPPVNLWMPIYIPSSPVSQILKVPLLQGLTWQGEIPFSDM